MTKGFRMCALLVTSVFTIMLTYGCGSSKKEGGGSDPVQEAALVGTDVCINCHSIETADWIISGHGNPNATPSLEAVGPVGGPEPCRNCHDPFDDGVKVAAVLGGNFNPRPANGCEVCHGNGGNHFGLGPIDKYRIAASATGSAQFNTCSRCHQVPDASGAEVTPFHSGTGRRIIDTHVGTPGNWGSSGTAANSKDITGYALQHLNDQTCTICHNPHTADATINRQWAGSRHADKTAAGAWAHYNWSLASRNACQRCHTASGIIAYTAFLKAGGDPAQFTGPLAPDANWRPEMLQCNGCHSNNRGALRNPGRVTETYADNVVVRFDDISNSNLCLTCHVGRESGGSIKARSANFSDIGFINSHYLTAGGTLFRTTGYEYYEDASGKYDNVAFFQHDKIGLTADQTGTQGPCIGCHMAFNVNSEKHTFLPLQVERTNPDKPLEITKIVAIRSTVCVVCHEGENELTVAEFEEQKTLFHEAMEAFDVQLQQKGYFFGDANPYFYTAPFVQGGTNTAVRNWLSPDDTDTSGNTTGKNNMGAAFNFNLIEHDPGAFVHNRFYVKRLIYDSIDWLDDNLLNDSVAGTLDSALHAGKPYQAGAKAYILSSTGGRP